MSHKIGMKSADEYDALTRWRKFLSWRAGQRAKVKKLFRRRERRVLNAQAHESAMENKND